MSKQRTQRLTRWDQLDAVLAKTEAASRAVRLDGDYEDEVRRVLSAHFARVPGHDLKDFGDEVEFESAEEHPVYRVELHTLYERREAARRIKPHDGGQLPTPRVTEASLDLWAFDNPPPDAFADGKEELRIDDSREVRQCGGCQGRKASDCTACQATGAVGCPRCKGTGREQCPRCGGTNVVSEKVNEIEKKTNCGCSFTRGLFERDGKVYSCPKCNNIGYTVRYEPIYATRPCGACPYEGQITCQGCRGKGKVRCDPPHGRCGGSGKLPCQTCQGSGHQVAYLAVVRTFTPGTAARTAAGDGIPAQAARELAKAGGFGPVCEIDSTEAREQLTPGRGGQPLKRAIAHVFQAGAAGKPEGCRIARQRLAVAVAHALKVEYKHEKTTFTAWLLGEEMTVFAPESPLTAALAEKVREAVDLWKGGQERKAALTLRDALDMAEKDPDCGAAYEELQGEIPRKLRERGKTATTPGRWARRNPLLVGCLLFVLVPPLLLGCLGVGTLALGLLSSGPSLPPADLRELERQAAEAQKRRDEERAKEVSVRFESTSHFLEAGKSGTLRVSVRREGVGGRRTQGGGDIVLKFEAPSNLTLPASVKVEKGQLEVEVPVTAGKQAGRFEVRVVPEGLKNTAFSDRCTVTVAEPFNPGVPPPTLPKR